MQVEEYLLVCFMFSVAFVVHSILDVRAKRWELTVQTTTTTNAKAPSANFLNVKISGNFADPSRVR